MKRLGVLGSALAFAAVVPLAAAAALIVPVSQTRSVSALADADPGDPSSASFSASDFGPFDRVASARSFDPELDPTGLRASIRQTSVIEETYLQAVVRGSMLYTLVYGPNYTQSVYDVTFDLTASASYALVNVLATGLGTGGFHAVTLWDENGQVIAQPLASYIPPGFIPQIFELAGPGGVLEAGRYRVTAQFDRNWASNFAGEAEFEAGLYLAFTPIPEPGTALLVALGLGALAARWRAA